MQDCNSTHKKRKQIISVYHNTKTKYVFCGPKLTITALMTWRKRNISDPSARKRTPEPGEYRYKLSWLNYQQAGSTYKQCTWCFVITDQDFAMPHKIQGKWQHNFFRLAKTTNPEAPCSVCNLVHRTNFPTSFFWKRFRSTLKSGSTSSYHMCWPMTSFCRRPSGFNALFRQKFGAERASAITTP